MSETKVHHLTARNLIIDVREVVDYRYGHTDVRLEYQCRNEGEPGLEPDISYGYGLDYDITFDTTK